MFIQLLWPPFSCKVGLLWGKSGRVLLIIHQIDSNLLSVSELPVLGKIQEHDSCLLQVVNVSEVTDKQRRDGKRLLICREPKRGSHDNFMRWSGRHLGGHENWMVLMGDQLAAVTDRPSQVKGITSGYWNQTEDSHRGCCVEWWGEKEGQIGLIYESQNWPSKSIYEPRGWLWLIRCRRLPATMIVVYLLFFIDPTLWYQHFRLFRKSNFTLKSNFNITGKIALTRFWSVLSFRSLCYLYICNYICASNIIVFSHMLLLLPWNVA